MDFLLPILFWRFLHIVTITYVCQKCKHIHNHSLLFDVGIMREIHVGPSGTAYYLDTLHLNDETHTDIVKRLLKTWYKN